MKINSASLERKFKSLIPSKLKVLLVDILTSELIGFMIKSYNPKFNFFNGFYDYKHLTYKEAALIFFGIWESAEIRFSKRFVDTETVIELGSSIGVTLGVLGKKLNNVRFICVEASPLNFKKLKYISTKLPAVNQYNIV